MSEAPAFQLYSADFYVDTNEWSVDEVGIYTRLLLSQWSNKSLPNNVTRLARIAGCSPQKFQKAWGQIAIKFTKNGDGRLQNPRLEREREKQQKYRELQAEKSKKGVEARRKQATHGSTRGSSNGSPDGKPLQSSDFSHKEKDIQAALVFPLRDNKEFELSLAKISEYEKTYRNIDVSFELKKCLQWNIDNPTKRKTERGILKHINGWLSDESKKKGPQPAAGIEHDTKAVDEARRDTEEMTPEKKAEAAKRIRELALNVGQKT